MLSEEKELQRLQQERNSIQQDIEKDIEKIGSIRKFQVYHINYNLDYPNYPLLTQYNS